MGKVICIDIDSRGKFGGLLDAHHRLRYRTFIEQKYWGGVRSFRGREYDEYDTLAATYLVRPSPEGRVWGCVRLTPTDRPYMLKDKWPALCRDGKLPESMSVWEKTRICVEQSLSRRMRTRIKNELLCASVEFALENDIRRYVAVCPPKVWKSVFGGAGLDVSFVGEEAMIEGGIVRAGAVEISAAVLRRVRVGAGIARRTLTGGTW